MSVSAVILAAGQGTRMRSKMPKVLHPLAGKPMVQHVIERCNDLAVAQIYLIYGHGREYMQRTLADASVQWVYQDQQLGTGHAVDQASAYFKQDKILILYGDAPLISQETLQRLIDAQPQDGIALLTVMLDDPSGYGRIMRDGDHVVGIVEHKDATAEQRQIKEVNTGMMVVNGPDLKQWLSELSNDNAQGEYYLTDIIAAAVKQGRQITTVHPQQAVEVEGANDRVQLAALERAYQLQQAQQLLAQGVTIMDPHRFDLRGQLTCGMDVQIDINVLIEGEVTLGDGVQIGAGCVLKDCNIAAGTQVQPYSIIEQSQIAESCQIGPYARLRPGSELHQQVHIGNFVEVKNSQIQANSKANHLSYLGDAQIGQQVNIGAGTITCNYDGANKHKTQIGDNVFVGSNSQLVAPVSIGEGVTIAAGTTLTKDIAEASLVMTRAQERRIEGWQRPKKKVKS